MCGATYLDSNSWLTLNIFGLWLGWMVFHGVAFSRDQTTGDAVQLAIEMGDRCYAP